jgi:hypothetical protein
MEETSTKLKNTYSFGIAIPFQWPIPRTKRDLSDNNTTTSSLIVVTFAPFRI